MYMPEMFLDEFNQDPDRVYKILLFKYRIRPKTDRIRNPDQQTGDIIVGALLCIERTCAELLYLQDYRLTRG